MKSTAILTTTAMVLGFCTTVASAHGPYPRPWQIQPFATMLECQAGTEPEGIAPYCEALLQKFAEELESCKTAEANSGSTADFDVRACEGQAAATAAARVTY